MAESKPTSEPTKQLEPQREPREPRALSTEYHKARKQLMLWAGILFIWELVGIDLEKAKDAGGDIGTIVGAIRSPQAVPWVLLILVGYFLFRFTVEWYQCHPARRGMRVARIDFIAAWIVSIAAYALYFGQTLSRVQFADRLQNPDTRASLISGFVAGLASIMFLRGIIRLKRRSPKQYAVFGAFLLIILSLVVAEMRLFGFSVRLVSLLIGALAGAALFGTSRLAKPTLLLLARIRNTKQV